MEMRPKPLFLPPLPGFLLLLGLRDTVDRAQMKPLEVTLSLVQGPAETPPRPSVLLRLGKDR